MNRRQVLNMLTVATVVAGVGTSTLASAATKHKVVKGSYTVTALPDPTIDVTDQSQVGKHCMNIDPTSADNHAFAVPAAGTLDVVLDSPSPARGPQGLGSDWDLYLLDSSGHILTSSTTPSSHEETIQPFTKKQGITIRSCNLLGAPNATVTWTFTYKK
jgi:hypothetical protein